MVEHICKKCGRSFKRKSHLQYHENRKIPCVSENDNNIGENNEISSLPNEDKILALSGQNGPFDENNSLKCPENAQNNNKHQCKYCKKYLSRSTHLKRHHKTCKKKKEYDEESKELYQVLLTKLQEHEEMIRKLAEENQLLKNGQQTQIMSHCNNDNSVTNNTNSNNTNYGTVNNVNIHINAVGQENTDFLTMKDKMEIVEKMHKSVITYIEKVNFNPDHPENHNVYVQNLKNSYGAMFNGIKWETRHISDIVESLMDYSRNKIEEIKEELSEKGKMRNYVEGRLDELFDAIDGDDSEASQNIMKVAEERIKFLAYDNREIVKETMDEWFENDKKNRKERRTKRANKGVII